MLNNFASTSSSFRGSRIVFLSTKWEMGEPRHDVRADTMEGVVKKVGRRDLDRRRARQVLLTIGSEYPYHCQVPCQSALRAQRDSDFMSNICAVDFKAETERGKLLG